jgi:hypothetical protein
MVVLRGDRCREAIHEIVKEEIIDKYPKFLEY